MPGPDVFCERCGARQPSDHREGAASGGGFARRLRSAVTGTTADGVRQSTDSIYLRLCLDCRGYSCPKCWNDEVGVCQTCAPLPEPEVIPLQTLAPVEPAAQPLISFGPEPEAFPDFETSYYFRPATAVDETEVEPEVEPEPKPVVVAEAEPVVVAEAEPEPEPVVVAEAEPEPVAEPVVVAEAGPEPVAEPVVVAEAEPEPVLVAEAEVEVEAEPVLMAEAEVEPEPVVVAEPEPVVPPAPVEPPTPPTPITQVPWLLPDPEPLPLAAAPAPNPPALPSELTVPAPFVIQRPQIGFDEAAAAAMAPLPPNPAPLPAAVQFAASQPAYHLPVPAARQAAQPVGVRPCHNCGLSVSAKARFCRRCGSAQMAN